MNNKTETRKSLVDIKIATLNLCLGLKFKKQMVEQILSVNNINILCMQEVEIENGFDTNLLSMKGFELEIENNSIKSRSGIYITENLKYTRKRNLEGKDSHLVIIDFEENSEIKRIINIYRCFNPNGNVTPREKFKYQLNLIKNAMIPKTVLLGDFNLDYEKIYDDSYAHKNIML